MNNVWLGCRRHFYDFQLFYVHVLSRGSRVESVTRQIMTSRESIKIIWFHFRVFENRDLTEHYLKDDVSIAQQHFIII